VNLRLDEQLVQQLLADYRAGRTGRQLAERYGLARSTVIGLLRKHGVEIRYPRITPAEQTEMVWLYR
jgi:DNA-binding transcriptional regulator LsrR (DeoR family)